MTAPDPAEAGFLAALRGRPHDDTARSAYADWLEDRGDPRAELLRLAVAERRQGAAPPGSRGHLLRLLFDPGWVSVAAGPLPTRAGVERTGLYERWVGRDSPGCVVFLMSRAGWLRSERLNGVTLAEHFARVVNDALAELLTACEFGEEKPRPLFHVALIGYGSDRDGTPVVSSLFSGTLAGRDWITIPELYDHPLEIERRVRRESRDDGAGGVAGVEVELRSPVWYRAGGGLWSGSPMCAGLDHVRRLTARWVLDHPDNFPPFVVHLTDGSSTDGDPTAAFDRLGAFATTCGPLFLINAVCGERHGTPAFLPAAPAGGDALARCHAGASLVPEPFRWALDLITIPTQPGSRSLVVNADPGRLLRLLPTGTSPLLFWARPQLPPHLR